MTPGIPAPCQRAHARSERVTPDSSQTFPGTVDHVPSARHWIVDRLGGHPAASLAELLGCEFVTNAVKHTRSGDGGTFTVTLHASATLALVAVDDDGADTVPAAQANGTALGGRGLFLVDHLAGAWGHQPTSRGRRVWCLAGTAEPFKDPPVPEFDVYNVGTHWCAVHKAEGSAVIIGDTWRALVGRCMNARLLRSLRQAGE